MPRHLVQIPVVLLSIDYMGPVRAAELAGEINPIDEYPHSWALFMISKLKIKSIPYFGAKPLGMLKAGLRILEKVLSDLKQGDIRHPPHFLDLNEKKIPARLD